MRAKFVDLKGLNEREEKIRTTKDIYRIVDSDKSIRSYMNRTNCPINYYHVILKALAESV